MKKLLESFPADVVICDSFMIAGGWMKESLFSYAFTIPDLVLHTSIPAFEYPRKAYPANFRFTGPIIISSRDDYDMPVWWQELENGFPVVLVNQGTIAIDHNNLIKPAIEGLKDEKINVIAVPVRKGEIAQTPKNVHTEPYIPFGNLLPHVDIMITNGGFGGTQNVLAHGIPVIIAGATEDKMEVAARVEYSGAGINLRNQQPTPEDIKNAVRIILNDPSYRNKARELKSIYSQYDAPKLAFAYIMDLIQEKNKLNLA